jgi:hypothetical protein
MNSSKARISPVSDLTARLESILRRLFAAARESEGDAARSAEQFRKELELLVAQYGYDAVNAALDELPDAASQSVYLH